MKAYFLTGLALGGIVLGAILIIRNESEKMRDAVRDVARETRQDLVHDAVKEGIEGVVDAVHEGAPEISGAIEDVITPSSRSDGDTDGNGPGRHAPSDRRPIPEKPKDRAATSKGNDGRVSIED